MQKGGPARCAGRPQHPGDARVVAHGRVQPVQHEPVFGPTGNDAAGEQQHTGECREQDRRPKQREVLQHVGSLFRIHHRLARQQLDQGRYQCHCGHYHQHIAQYSGHLGAHQVSHLVDKAIQCSGLVQVFELGRHGRRRHGRLFGGQRPVHQADGDEAGGVNQAGPKPFPEGRQRDPHQHEFEPGRDGSESPAARGLAKHGTVLCLGAGDVMFTRLRAAFGHFGGQQRRVGCHQCAHTAPLLPNQHQVRDQACGAGARAGRGQAVQQCPDPQDALAQLAQPEHQVD